MILESARRLALGADLACCAALAVVLSSGQTWLPPGLCHGQVARPSRWVPQSLIEHCNTVAGSEDSGAGAGRPFDKRSGLAESTSHECTRRQHLADYYFHHSRNGGLASDRIQSQPPAQTGGFCNPPFRANTENPHARHADRHRFPAFPPFPPISPPVRRGRIRQGQPSQLDYLRQILSARVYDIARETELEPARGLSARLGNAVYLKREDNQPVFSFKVRGAYNKMRNTPQAALDRGVITASAGNHAQGVAISAARLGVRATIVVPQTAPQVKVDAVRAHGGPTVEVVLAGDSYSDAYAHAQTLARRQELTFIPAFDDPYVIAGQGTVGMEILRQMPSAPDVVFVPIGGGSLAAGVSTYVKAVNPAVRVVGVQTEDSCAMAQSLRAGERVNLAEVGLFSDGTAVKLVGEETFRLCREYLDEVILVDTDAVCAAIRTCSWKRAACWSRPARWRWRA